MPPFFIPSLPTPTPNLSPLKKNSLDPSAENTCLTTISTALSLLPSSPSPHQTHASILISQSDPAAARTALRTALTLWRALPPAHPDVPDFAARISLARLLLEVGMEEDALGVVGGCVDGDDECVEGWYLGGWGLFLLGEKEKEKVGNPDPSPSPSVSATTTTTTRSPSPQPPTEAHLPHWRSSREWLLTCLRLYDGLGYDDERMRAHALELVAGIEAEFAARGLRVDDEGDDGDEVEGEEEREGEDEEGDGDEVMG